MRTRRSSREAEHAAGDAAADGDVALLAEEEDDEALTVPEATPVEGESGARSGESRVVRTRVRAAAMRPRSPRKQPARRPASKRKRASPPHTPPRVPSPPTSEDEPLSARVRGGKRKRARVEPVQSPVEEVGIIHCPYCTCVRRGKRRADNMRQHIRRHHPNKALPASIATRPRGRPAAGKGAGGTKRVASRGGPAVSPPPRRAGPKRMSRAIIADVDDGDEDEGEGRGEARVVAADVEARAYASDDGREPVLSDPEYVEGASDGEEEEATYFSTQNEKVRTSSHTLKELNRVHEEQLVDAIAKVGVRNRKLVKELRGVYKAMFPKWFFHLRCGFNLLFLGFGSKKDMLQRFAHRMLSDAPVLIVNGYSPGVSVKQLLNSITEGVLETNLKFKTPLDQVEYIARVFAEDERAHADSEEEGGGGGDGGGGDGGGDGGGGGAVRPQRRVYVVVHNIDGPNLRTDSAQLALSLLAEIPRVHLIASVDHINATTLWDNAKTTRFNWLWHQMHTYEPYKKETAFESFVGVSGTSISQGALHVLRSLTDNARAIFRVLAEYQLAHPDEGLSFHDYYGRCREDFLVNSDLTMRTQLTEFRDHELIQTKRRSDGSETLFIPLPADTLQSILQEIDDDDDDDDSGSDDE